MDHQKWIIQGQRKHLATVTIDHSSNAIDHTGALHCPDMKHSFMRSVIWATDVFIPSVVPLQISGHPFRRD